MTRRGAQRIEIWTFNEGVGRSRRDELAVEEPLEMRVRAGGAQRSLAITMRTPGNDFELAAGFLFSEGLIADRQDIAQIAYCVDPQVDGEQRYNIVQVVLRQDELPDLT
ncbi:MAG: formate dehydrogenase accessory sulfurtransferase FdhD, partial [Chloroflexaceae bacterium]